MDPCDNLSRVFRVGTRKSLPLRAHLLSEVSGLTSNKAKIEPPCVQREELKHTLPLKQHLSARCHVFRGTNAGRLRLFIMTVFGKRGNICFKNNEIFKDFKLNFDL